MTFDRRDPLDLQIDEALAALTAGEPRRVNAATVRAAIEAAPRRAVPRPGPWLALAAVLLIGLSLGPFRRVREGSPPGARPSTSTAVSRESVPRRGTEPTILAAASLAAIQPSTARRRALSASAGEVWPDAFPRLDVPSIQSPDPLARDVLPAEPLQFARIEITPLLITDLNHEPDFHP